MPPRFLRSRLVMLPLAGLLVGPVSSTPSAAADGKAGILQARATCKPVDTPARKVEPPRSPPSCVDCRTPLINAPLARGDRSPVIAPGVARPILA